MIETAEDYNARLGQCGCCQIPICPQPSIRSESKTKSLNGLISGHSGILFREVEYTAEKNSTQVSYLNTTKDNGPYYYLERTTTTNITAHASRKLHHADGLTGGHYYRNVTTDTTEDRYSITPYDPEAPPYGTFSGSSSDTRDADFVPATPATLEGTRRQTSSYTGETSTDTTVDFSIGNNLGSGLSFSTSDPANLYWRDRTDSIVTNNLGWDFIRATWTNPYDFPEAVTKLTEDLSSQAWVNNSTGVAWSAVAGGISSVATGEKVTSATLTLRRFRFRIPNTHLGSYFKITYDIADFPTDTSIAPSFASQDNVVEWSGPGTGSSSDPSWLTPWVEIAPPEIPGQRRVVNIRYVCRHGAVFPALPQVMGEALEIPEP